MDAPDERTPIEKYYDDERLFKELALQQTMAHLYTDIDTASPSQSSIQEHQSDRPLSNSSKASLIRPLSIGNASGAGNVSRNQLGSHASSSNTSASTYIPRIHRHCDDLLESLRNGDNPRPQRQKKASPPKKSPSDEPIARYRGVPDNPSRPVLEDVPDWYLESHQEMRTKYPYDVSHFLEGYTFYSKGPQASSSATQEYTGRPTTPDDSLLSPLTEQVTHSVTPIAPLNHPAVDSRLVPPHVIRFRYSEAQSAQTHNIDETIEKVRHYELSAQEGVTPPASGSPYVDRLRKSVRYASPSQRYPAELLEMYDDDEPQLLPDIHEEKPEIPEIRVEEPEPSTALAEETDLSITRVEEPTLLTVPDYEEVPDTCDLPPILPQPDADARSVGEKSDGSANGYGDFFEYYSRTSNASVTQGEDDEMMELPPLHSSQTLGLHGKEHKPYVPVLAPLFEEPSRSQLRAAVPAPQEESKPVAPSHPTKAVEEKLDISLGIPETASTPYDEEVEKEQEAIIKPLPAYVEHGEDLSKENRRSVCDGKNFWREEAPAGNSIKDRVIVEKPVTIEKSSAPPPVPSKRRVPQPHSIVGSDSPPLEIKDTNTLRRPTIVEVEPTNSLPPPVPPKRPLTPDIGPPPPPKSDEHASYPSPHHQAPLPPPSMADIGRGLRVEDEEVYNKPQRDSFDARSQHGMPSKAMKVLGVGMDDIQQTSSFEGGVFTPFTPIAGSNLEKEVNHITKRKSKLDQDPSKSSKSLLGFRGGVSNFFRKRDKTGTTNINTDVPKVDKRASVESGTSTPDSSRSGLFKRLFNNKRQSDAPSTTPSIESYGGSHRNHESWDSSRASGDTGLTSNDDTFSFTSPQTALDAGKSSISDTLNPAEYMDDRINPNFSVKLDEKSLKSKRSIFFGRDKKEEPELIPGLGIPAPKGKKGGAFGFFTKDKEPEYDYSGIVEDMKQRIVERADFERSEAFTQQREKEFVDQQKAKMIKGQAGYFNSKGEYFRAKNPLELALCDSENSQPESFSEVKHNYENEKPEPVKDPKRWGAPDYMPPRDPNDHRKDLFLLPPDPDAPLLFGGIFKAHLPTPIVEEPQTVIAESETAHETIEVKSPVQPGFSPENEPPSHWSDDSDEEDNDGQLSQPPTPSNPSFGRSAKTHRRTGSGSSNLGTGPMFMKKAVRKFKANRKSAEVRVVPSQASKGNRDSVMSQTSTGSNRNVPASTSVPPVPAPPIPTRGSTDAGNRSEVRTSGVPVPEVSVTSPPDQLTTGTYHDQKDNVVHHFGGTIPERSGSSLGHRADENNVVNNLPERSKSSLGHHATDGTIVRNGIKCTADVTPDDIFAFMRAQAQANKQKADEAAKQKRQEEIRLKEVEARIKREKKAAKSDKWIEKENKRQAGAIQKSKFRVSLATKIAEKVIQREATNLKDKGVHVPNEEIDGWI
ncbi:hypothetical protein TWF281_004088 [Arthrobotrys megalospora]